MVRQYALPLLSIYYTGTLGQPWTREVINVRSTNRTSSNKTFDRLIGENRAFILTTSEFSAASRRKKYASKTYLNSDVYERHPFQKRFRSVGIFDQLLDGPIQSARSLSGLWL